MAIKLGDLLVQTRVISQEQLEAALDRQAAYGGKLGEVLLHCGFVNEDVLVRAVSKLTGIPRAGLAGEADPLALGRVRREVAEQGRLVPVSLSDDGHTLVVAMVDPQSEADLELARSESGCAVVPRFATATEIRDAQVRWYPAADRVTAPIALGRAGSAQDTDEPPAQPSAAQTHAPHQHAALEHAPQPHAAQEHAPQPHAAEAHAPQQHGAQAHGAVHAAEPHQPHAAEPHSQPQWPPPLLSLRSGRLAVAALAVLALLLAAAVAYAAALRSRLETAGRGIEAHLKTIALQAQQVDALDQLATRVDQFNHEFGGLAGRLQLEDLELGLGRLQKKGDLPAQAKQLLAEFEKNAAEIRSMGAQLKELQEYLGAPTQVKRGDTHAQLALAYLTQRAGLQQAQAEAVLRQTALAWDIEPGNQVYSLYRDGILLTTVTQGTAARPPLAAQYAQRRALQSKALALEGKLRECESRGQAAP